MNLKRPMIVAALLAVLATTAAACGDDDNADSTETTNIVIAEPGVDTTEPSAPTEPETTVPDTTDPDTTEPDSSARAASPPTVPRSRPRRPPRSCSSGLTEDEATDAAEACGWILRVVRPRRRGPAGNPRSPTEPGQRRGHRRRGHRHRQHRLTRRLHPWPTSTPRWRSPRSSRRPIVTVGWSSPATSSGCERRPTTASRSSRCTPPPTRSLTADFRASRRSCAAARATAPAVGWDIRQLVDAGRDGARPWPSSNVARPRCGCGSARTAASTSNRSMRYSTASSSTSPRSFSTPGASGPLQPGRCGRLGTSGCGPGDRVRFVRRRPVRRLDSRPRRPPTRRRPARLVDEGRSLCADHPNVRVATIDGTRFHDAGASDAQELGDTLAVVRRHAAHPH